MAAEALSPRNAEVARLRALARERRARHEAGRFVVEGPKLVAEALAAGLIVYDAFVEEGWTPSPELQHALEADDVEVTVVSQRGIERIASTNSPQPIVAEVKIPRRSLDELAGATAVLVAVDVNDPGNLGTLARSAVAAGFDAVVALGDTVDAWSPKVVRSSAGALFHVPVVVERDVHVGLVELASLGLTRYGTRMADATACNAADLSVPIALVLGSEAHGLGDDHDGDIDGWLSIPMHRRAESLNVAMAGTILAYEASRQRQK